MDKCRSKLVRSRLLLELELFDRTNSVRLELYCYLPQFDSPILPTILACFTNYDYRNFIQH
ncbi:hypothetical protein [Argonema galeatum]|uniref:hypothetical protein n=1 Tax=Argonema galeatum TaxID=2942762 RepID=UPI00201321A2|nr:hypothetical protein [Argonema galeatum]MCL1463327.1 hypothetical protein [Argonema galeatum A003/A1]